ncbi:DUF3606 domain-containing protein [Sphingobium lactosutens]|uniref:DUF3606 domain-containing protein n=1 Tax=Sphingobium lactosutens TaxID=522773 RepID=UPI0003FF64B9|nr:DUF3606 domain-containing protein [Sphingobium lactosutens]
MGSIFEGRSNPLPTPQDLKQVHCDRAAEARYWTQRLGTDRHALEEAVERVGHNLGAVKAFLEGRERTHV